MSARAYHLISERIIAMLEAGTVPWRKSWKTTTGIPRNLISRRGYRGINYFVLAVMGYESPYWLTFRQISELGGTVRSGEHACPLVFWQKYKAIDRVSKEPVEIPMLRYYHVFNTAQCRGLSQDLIDEANASSPSIRSARELVEKMPDPPTIRHGFASPLYSPRQDCVHMPDEIRFATTEDYYSTLFHELVHATGHERRLARATLTESRGFGSDPYCKEELVAEMGASFLAVSAGISAATIENSAAYLAAWVSRLRAEPVFVVQAASFAQRAADFILGMDADAQDRETSHDGNPNPPSLGLEVSTPAMERETVTAF